MKQPDEVTGGTLGGWGLPGSVVRGPDFIEGVPTQSRMLDTVGTRYDRHFGLVRVVEARP